MIPLDHRRQLIDGAQDEPRHASRIGDTVPATTIIALCVRMGLKICWFDAGNLCFTPKADTRFVVSQGRLRGRSECKDGRVDIEGYLKCVGNLKNLNSRPQKHKMMSNVTETRREIVYIAFDIFY